jgi:hypothetical protein
MNAQHDREVRNAALEDAAIVCDIFAEVNDDSAWKGGQFATDVVAFKARADLCRKLAESIRAKKDFGKNN